MGDESRCLEAESLQARCLQKMAACYTQITAASSPTSIETLETLHCHYRLSNFCIDEWISVDEVWIDMSNTH